jgi:hypothetical protein
MSCYIQVVSDAGEDHPTWEWGLSGNWDYASLYHSLPKQVAEWDENLPPALVPERFRPTDFPVWRDAIRKAGFLNREAHLGLMDILEEDPRWWIRVS